MRDALFSGSVPKLYEAHLVPMIFEPFALDLASRLAGRSGVTRVLEIAAGTGVLTRALTVALPHHVAIVATDLNQAMLDQAIATGTSRPVEWRQADAMSLPFPQESFDAVICQFGVMFFPDRPKAFAGTRRVLTPAGLFLFSVWTSLGDNEIAETVDGAVAALFPDDPPHFLQRTPSAYGDPARIASDLAAGGFSAPPRVETLAARGRAASALDAAIAFCQGTPLRAEIETRDPGRLAEATAAAAAAIEARFGKGPIDTGIRAHIVMVEKR